MRLNGQDKSKARNTMFLGTTVDCNLSRSAHVEKVVSKLDKSYYVTKSLKGNVSQKALSITFLNTPQYRITLLYVDKRLKHLGCPSKKDNAD